MHKIIFRKRKFFQFKSWGVFFGGGWGGRNYLKSLTSPQKKQEDRFWCIKVHVTCYDR